MLRNVSKFYGFKPSSKKNIQVTALNSAIEHLETTWDSVLQNVFPKSISFIILAINRFYKCNDEIIQLDEQVTFYNLFEAIKNVRLLIKNKEFNNTSKEVFGLLEDFEKSVEKIVKNVEIELIDKKRQILVMQHEKKRKKKPVSN